MTWTLLDRLSGTRRALLISIKQRGGADVQSLADELFLSPSAVRQQLALLAEEGLIAYRVDRGGPGRPTHTYFVTPVGDDYFPQAYDEMLHVVLSVLEAEGHQISEEALNRMAALTFGGDESLWAGKSADDRLTSLLQKLREGGFYPGEPLREGGEIRIRLQHCPSSNVATRHPALCEAEERCMSKWLGRDVRRGADRRAGNDYCEYVFPVSFPEVEGAAAGA